MKHLTTEEKDSLNVFMQENNLTKESKFSSLTERMNMIDQIGYVLS
jgi:hypothetical protein